MRLPEGLICCETSCGWFIVSSAGLTAVRLPVAAWFIVSSEGLICCETSCGWFIVSSEGLICCETSGGSDGSAGPQSQVEYWWWFHSPVWQGIFLTMSTFRADYYGVHTVPRAAVCIAIGAHL